MCLRGQEQLTKEIVRESSDGLNRREHGYGTVMLIYKQNWDRAGFHPLRDHVGQGNGSEDLPDAAGYARLILGYCG